MKHQSETSCGGEALIGRMFQTHCAQQLLLFCLQGVTGQDGGQGERGNPGNPVPDTHTHTLSFYFVFSFFHLLGFYQLLSMKLLIFEEFLCITRSSLMSTVCSCCCLFLFTEAVCGQTLSSVWGALTPGTLTG